MVHVVRDEGASGPSIGLVLSDDSMFLDSVSGQPHSGVALNPAQARELAYTLLLHAQQVENIVQARNVNSTGR